MAEASIKYISSTYKKLLNQGSQNPFRLSQLVNRSDEGSKFLFVSMAERRPQ